MHRGKVQPLKTESRFRSARGYNCALGSTSLFTMLAIARLREQTTEAQGV